MVILGIWSGIGGIFQGRLLATRLKWRRRNAIIKTKARLAEEEASPEEVEKELAAISEALTSSSPNRPTGCACRSACWRSPCW